MKKFVLFSFAFLMFAATHAQTSATNVAASENGAVLQFSETDHDFGKIPYGKPAEFDLLIKNVSTDSVKIDNVVAGCGCTTPKWEAGPYGPGEDFKITVGFNGYTEGSFRKVITVYYKDGMTQVINFHGETFKAPDNAAPVNGAVDKLKSSDGK